MNDRFKFRGMTLGGEWVYGNLAIINEKIKSCGMNVDAGSYISNKVGMPFAYPVRPETIEQCTGLKDKNGKLIYEGDILTDGANTFIVNWYDDMALFRLLYNNDREIYCLFYPSNAASLYTVIGNIHENTDLLEVNND